MEIKSTGNIHLGIMDILVLARNEEMILLLDPLR
jgi:hypothetical protein